MKKTRTPKSKSRSSRQKIYTHRDDFLKSIPLVRKSVLVRTQNQDTVQILDPMSYDVYAARSIAGHIFLQLDGSKTVEEILLATKKDLKIRASDFFDRGVQYIKWIFLQGLADLIEKRIPPPKNKLKLEMKSLSCDLSSLEVRFPVKSLSLSSASCGTGSGS